MSKPALQSTYSPPQSVWSGFYRKALKERQNQLKLVFPGLFTPESTNSSPEVHSTSQPCVSECTAAKSLPITPTKKTSRTPRSTSPVPAHDLLEATALFQQTDGSVPEVLEADATSMLVLEKKEEDAFPIRGLDASIADNMVENCIGTIGLPVGLALNFVINGRPLVIPMAIEEPSVIAAVSGAAKTICASAVGGKGFQAVAPVRNVIIAQVVLLDLDAKGIEDAKRTLEINYDAIIDAGNQLIPNMTSRGGGVFDFKVRIVPRLANPNPRHRADLLSSGVTANNEKWLVCHFHIDVCDAMGANCASTVAEGTAPFLASLTGGRIGLRIVSNLCVERLAKASFRVPVPSLAYKSHSGLTIATRLLEAYEWAESDPFRATTHNKGVMNGVDAVALATGQDWRAISAASHAWASYNAIPGSSTSYRSLTRYWIEKEHEGDDLWDEESARSTGKGLVLCAELELPLLVGTKGGVLNTNPTYAYTLGIMGYPNAKNLAMAMVSVGLAQNFGALRALVSEGIQRGHMSLHARNIAVAAGCPSHAINEVTAYMVSTGRINVTTATEYLRAHELLARLRKHLFGSDGPELSLLSQPRTPSMFYFDLDEHSTGLANSPLPFSLNIAFQSYTPNPVQLELTSRSKLTPLHRALFGDKTHAWLSATFPLLESVQLLPPVGQAESSQTNLDLAKKLKALSILVNIVLRRLVKIRPAETRAFVEKVLAYSLVNGKETVNDEHPQPSLDSASKSPSAPAYSSSLSANDGHTSSSSYPANCSAVSAFVSHIYRASSASISLAGSESGGPSVMTFNLPRPLTPGCGPESAILSAGSPSKTEGRSQGESNDDIQASSGDADRNPTPSPRTSSPSSWSLQNSGIFRADVLRETAKAYANSTSASLSMAVSASPSDPASARTAAGADADTNDDVPTPSTILQVGLPLFLALWQVFELRVAQWVGHPLLASTLLEEQRLVISSLVAVPEEGGYGGLFDEGGRVRKRSRRKWDGAKEINLDEDEQERQRMFRRFMSVHAKRFQVTLLLLCDAVTFDPRFISPFRLENLLSLGCYLEWVWTVAHDLGRLRRDRGEGNSDASVGGQGSNHKSREEATISTSGLNSALIYMEVDTSSSDMSSNLYNFVQATSRLTHRRHLLAQTTLSEDHDRILGMMDRATKGLRRHYGVENWFDQSERYID